MEVALGGMWAFGGADFWNPVGWVVLIAAAVLTIGYLIWKNWDSIVAFVEWAGNGIADAWNWVCETATDVWDSLTKPEPIPVAEPVPETRPITVPTDIPIPRVVPLPLDKTKPIKRGPFNVYDVHVNIPGNYGDYLRGIIDPTSVFLAAGEIYKYGITQYASVLRRYQAFSWTSPKEAMILENLTNGSFGPFEWYAFRIDKGSALAIESALISAYIAIRGKLPPGNTGLY